MQQAAAVLNTQRRHRLALQRRDGKACMCNTLLHISAHSLRGIMSSAIALQQEEVGFISAHSKSSWLASGLMVAVRALSPLSALHPMTNTALLCRTQATQNLIMHQPVHMQNTLHPTHTTICL